MKTIKLSLSTAKQLYDSGDENFKMIALGAYTEKELNNKILIWKDLKKIKGFYIDLFSGIISVDSYVDINNLNVFATKKQARSTLAYAQITQLLENSPEYHSTINWKDDNPKYNIVYNNKDNLFDVDVFNTWQVAQFCFDSKEKAELFIKHNKQLLLDYFQIEL